MIFLYRILLKIRDIYHNMVKIATIEVAKSKGMKVGKNFFVQGIPNFGSEPFLIEIGDHVTIAENVGFINHGGDARVTKRIERYKTVEILEEFELETIRLSEKEVLSCPESPSETIVLSDP